MIALVVYVEPVTVDMHIDVSLDLLNASSKENK
ncbi:protein of unknown function [Bartonella clarridgeiae 73]|uniref:Uncharacterized protein n=2 Tax=Bartonella clarridgeiae TaxID=56426 RepID=E6YJI9_BARC7|nr:protein of unknown function [Bartonella clarridgeiae 73]